MKKIKYISVGAFIMVLSFLAGYYLRPQNPFSLILLFLMLGFFIFNLTIRKSLSFKNYFTSKYNLFTAKIWSEKSYDISKELMFEKIIEVINDSDFNLTDTNKDELEILALSPTTLISWGENLYISFETKEDQTVLKFCSATLFQSFSWGKNKKNYDHLLNEIESSLTV